MFAGTNEPQYRLLCLFKIATVQGASPWVAGILWVSFTCHIFHSCGHDCCWHQLAANLFLAWVHPLVFLGSIFFTLSTCGVHSCKSTQPRPHPKRHSNTQRYIRSYTVAKSMEIPGRPGIAGRRSSLLDANVNHILTRKRPMCIQDDGGSWVNKGKGFWLLDVVAQEKGNRNSETAPKDSTSCPAHNKSQAQCSVGFSNMLCGPVGTYDQICVGTGEPDAVNTAVPCLFKIATVQEACPWIRGILPWVSFTCHIFPSCGHECCWHRRAANLFLAWVHPLVFFNAILTYSVRGSFSCISSVKASPSS